MRHTTTLLVPEIHPVNWPLYWCLSWFATVHAHLVHPLCARLLRAGRIGQFFIGECFSVHESHCFRSETLRRWETLLTRVPAQDWRVSYRGHVLDFSVKAKQDLGRWFEQLALLQEIQARSTPGSHVRVISSAAFRYLAGRGIPSAVFEYPTWPMVSRINIFCDLLWYALLGLAKLGRLIGRLLHGMVFRTPRSRLTHQTFRYLYYCDNPNELHLSRDKRSLTWLVDDQLISSEEVLFLIDPSMKSQLGEGLRRSPHHVFTVPELYHLMPRARLWSALREAVSVWVRYGARLSRFVPLFQFHYLLKTLEMDPVIHQCQPAVFVESISSISIEHPAIVYLNRLGIKTVMYMMAASHPFCHQGCHEDFRVIQNGHILASTTAVWNLDWARYLEGLPQEVTRLEVVGPMMPGDERVLNIEKQALRSRYGLTRPKGVDHVTYVSIFDVPAQATEHLRRHGRFPYLYSEELNVRFFHDILRLMQEIESLVVFYKPKRSLAGAPWSYPPAWQDAVRALRDSRRGVVLEEEINPWVPIALADLCISLPLTSPTLAALHYGIPGLFHDPLNEVHQHRYHALSAYITHDYETLKARVREILLSGRPASRLIPSPRSALWECISPCPGQNANARFRQFLRAQRHGEDARHSLGERVELACQ